MLPFEIKGRGYFNFEGAMAFAYWCEQNIEGNYAHSDRKGRVEACVQRVEVKYSIEVKSECAFIKLPCSFDFKKYRKPEGA